MRIPWWAVLASLSLAIVATFLALSLGATDPTSQSAGASTAALALMAHAELAATEDSGPRGEPGREAAPSGDQEDQGGGLADAHHQKGRDDQERAGIATPVALAMADSTDLPAAPVAEARAAVAEFDPALDPDARPNMSARTGTRPAEEPVASPTPTPIRAITKHRVVEGDSVSGLAERYQISAETIVRANRLENPESLSPGQELVILPVSGQLHVVQTGDTVLELAARYGVIPEDIVAANRLADPNALQVGRELVIPEVPVAIRTAPPAEPQPLPKPMALIKYRVVQGDTLTGVAQRFGISVESVLWANPGLANPQQLQIGQPLVLPPVSGVLHTVTARDTVSDVAARYGASAAEIIRVNALAEPYLLRLGQVLVVPGGTLPAQVVADSRPTATPRPTPKPAPTNTPRPAGAATPSPVPQAPPPSPQVAVAAVQGSSRGQQVVDIAMRYLGYRYVWGGSSPGTGFDCSGLTSYAYRQAGRPIPRDLWGQLNAGPRISQASLQPGDLVFFQNTYRIGLSHVGIYVGGGRFVHAASEYTGVIVTGLGEAYWNARYVGASRP